MIELFTGPAPLAQLVHHELMERGVGSELRSTDSGLSFLGSVAAPAAFQAVLVTEELAQSRRAAIDEVLALVSEPDLESEPADES
jgi:hypothetical protein